MNFEDKRLENLFKGTTSKTNNRQPELPGFSSDWIGRQPGVEVSSGSVLNPGRSVQKARIAAVLLLVLITGFTWLSQGGSSGEEFAARPNQGSLDGLIDSYGLEEIIFLKSGNILRGKVLMQKGNYLLVHADGNRNIKINSSRIARIKYLCHGSPC